MRLLLALIIIIYLVGVGVFLAPTVRSTWNSEPASGFAAERRAGAAGRPRLAGQGFPQHAGILSAEPITISRSLRPADIPATCASISCRA